MDSDLAKCAGAQGVLLARNFNSTERGIGTLIGSLDLEFRSWRAPEHRPRLVYEVKGNTTSLQELTGYGQSCIDVIPPSGHSSSDRREHLAAEVQSLLVTTKELPRGSEMARDPGPQVSSFLLGQEICIPHSSLPDLVHVASAGHAFRSECLE